MQRGRRPCAWLALGAARSHSGPLGAARWRSRAMGMVSIPVDSRLDPLVETTTLDNGLAVTTVALPHLHTAVVALFIKVGARVETPADNGVSHFVEHMLFRGTERYATSLELNTAVERLGSALHAETGRDYTLFQLALEPGYLAPGIDLLG